MYMGTIVNALAIIVAATVGVLIFKNGIQERFKNILMYGIGASLMMLGIMEVVSSVDVEGVILVILFVAVGSIIGEWINIDKYLVGFASWLGGKFGKTNERFQESAITSIVLFCSGAMPIMGALESGLTGSNSMFFAKSFTDGIGGLVLGSMLGPGVIISGPVLFVYQIILTTIASLAGDIVPAIAITYVQAVGGTLLLVLAINIMEIKEIKIANMTPALFLPFIWFAIF